ncbi:MAG: methylated-DNA--[protein]-cysteine S-methyltransferase [Archangium sp.]|nr:methylated-DNA--[protein]-cysteine S-methyltransferase [Archangium sp.]
MKSPIGTLSLVENEGALVGLYMESGTPPPAERRGSALLERVQEQLREYFAGKRTGFDLPLRLEGTDFQRSVWGQLAKIPFGETCSYADIARRIRRPLAVRAVGAANGANPISVIIPCHRVIGANGALTGYGGGIPRKKWLLAHENPALSLPL